MELLHKTIDMNDALCYKVCHMTQGIIWLI